MAETSIEWTDATWNPVAGCTVLTAGCTNCYAMRMAARLDAWDSANTRASPDRAENDGLDWKNPSGPKIDRDSNTTSNVWISSCPGTGRLRKLRSPPSGF
jgi:protein gp37